MAGHIVVKCPTCQTTYRISAKYQDKRLRCTMCKNSFQVAAPPPPAGSDFDDTVVGWLVELDRAVEKQPPQPRIISSRTNPAHSPVQGRESPAAGDNPNSSHA